MDRCAGDGRYERVKGVRRTRQVYNADGCYLCLNYQGQGTGSRKPNQNPGPNLAPAPIPYAAFIHQLRVPRLAMPSYDAKILSDQDAADHHAFFLAQPATKDPHSIAVLNVVNAGNTPHGAVLFSANCASCHGAAGQGGIGPALKGESARKDTAAAIALLSEGDVAAVAEYIESLH